jgi:hypothetical protein
MSNTTAVASFPRLALLTWLEGAIGSWFRGIL